MCIISMMKSEGFGAHFLTAMSLSLIHFVCYVFVDDSDVVHTGATINSTGEEVQKNLLERVTKKRKGKRNEAKMELVRKNAVIGAKNEVELAG